ncbi:MAG: hypothetical protein AAFU79_31675 [Myxococcota bacterium]
MLEITDEMLSAYVEGDLTETEWERVEAKLQASPELQARLSEITEIAALAASLEEEPSLPRRDLWPGIQERVFAPPWWRRALDALDPGSGRAGFSMAAAVAGALVVGIFIGPMAQERFGGRPQAEPTAVMAARDAYRSAIHNLEARAIADAAKLPPETREILERSLAEVDAAIQRAESALSEAPEDVFAHRMLMDLYDEKIRVLEASVARSEEETG